MHLEERASSTAALTGFELDPFVYAPTLGYVSKQLPRTWNLVYITTVLAGASGAQMISKKSFHRVLGIENRICA